LTEKRFPPLFFSGRELDSIFNFLHLMEVENFVEHKFLSPCMFEKNDWLIEN